MQKFIVASASMLALALSFAPAGADPRMVGGGGYSGGYAGPSYGGGMSPGAGVGIGLGVGAIGTIMESAIQESDRQQRARRADPLDWMDGPPPPARRKPRQDRAQMTRQGGLGCSQWIEQARKYPEGSQMHIYNIDRYRVCISQR